MNDVIPDWLAIKQRVDPRSDDDPWLGTTIEQNLADLGWHQKEFELSGRSCFVSGSTGRFRRKRTLRILVSREALPIPFARALRSAPQTGASGSFAYTVVTDESECLGCVYVNPSADADVEVRLWITRPAWDEGLDPELQRAVRDWIERDWPFERVAYPGRE